MHFVTRWAMVCTLAATLAACSKNNNQPDAGVTPSKGLGAPFKIVIQSADIPASGNPTVTFLLTEDDGTPIDDLATEIANAAATAPQPTPRMTPHFTLAQLEDDQTYTNLYEVTVNAAAYKDSAGVQQNPTGSAVQPRTEPPSPFPTAQLQAKGGGVYTYTFTAPTTSATKLERTRSHTLGFYATRVVAPQGSELSFPVSATLAFVPGGSTPTTFEHVTDAACNACHGVLRAHDQRRTVPLCLTCHAGDRGTLYQDPETLANLDLRSMVHKIHRGGDLPSVVNGGKFHIVGFRQTDVDFSDVGFPRDILDCAVCHQGKDATAWRASAPACLSCHDNVKLDATGTVPCGSGVTAPACNHAGGQVGATANCALCHTQTEISTQHVSPVRQAMGRFAYEITDVTTGADRKPVVSFRVVDPTSANKPYVLVGPPDEPWNHGSDSRLAVDIGWPSTEYNNAGSGASYGQPISIDALKNAVAAAGQTGVYQVTSPKDLPAGVEDFTVVLEGHPAVANPAAAGKFLRVPVTNALRYTKVSGGAGAERRLVVDTAKCNACHELINAHGQNRTGNVQVCTVCHNPDATDQGRRAATPPITTGEQAVDLKVLIHEVHAADVRETPVEIIGFGGSKNDFPLPFPRDIGNCTICHATDTWKLPLKAEVTDTTIATGADPASPADNTRLGRTQAICLSCHDTTKFDGSASQTCGTGITGPCNHPTPNATESQCAGCHGAGATADLAKFHPVGQ
ncbi:MAG TPA: OmcA/MtrC family decaheme c-type cytochrome [Myxococcales bacterium]|jgi:OmcA/MtrC family decaheme c-type cytochrome